MRKYDEKYKELYEAVKDLPKKQLYVIDDRGDDFCSSLQPEKSRDPWIIETHKKKESNNKVKKLKIKSIREE